MTTSELVQAEGLCLVEIRASEGQRVEDGDLDSTESSTFARRRINPILLAGDRFNVSARHDSALVKPQTSPDAVAEALRETQLPAYAEGSFSQGAF